MLPISYQHGHSKILSVNKHWHHKLTECFYEDVIHGSPLSTRTDLNINNTFLYRFSPAKQFSPTNYIVSCVKAPT